MSAPRSTRQRLLIPFAVGLVALGFGLVGFTGCNTTVDPPQLSSLRRSGRSTFLCIGPDGKGAPLTFCPQGPRLNDGGLTVARVGYNLHALVTQTATAEVAVVRVTGYDSNGNSTGRVLDADSANPGVTPLRVGQQPVDIVTTPGGEATFVGVAEAGRAGIFGLPTSCIFEPEEGETKRDLTTWPACSLSSAPGEMVMVVDPADADGNVRASCGGAYEMAAPSTADRSECVADLSRETAQLGRRKLLVALPDEGKLVVIDAQALLDRPQGSFERCVFEEEHALEVRLPSRILQPLPPDLVSAGCTEAIQEYGPFDGPFESRPSGMAVQENVLIVGDQKAPVIHVLDVRDPCSLDEFDPLIATSFNDPERIVTTNRVAISPTTPDGKQYVYAIDEVGEKVASVMVYDVSPGQVSRTPLVRPGSGVMTLEPPDRIEFLGAAKDVAFAILDRPVIDTVTGTAAYGTRCDPDPSIDPNSPAARYRPNLDDQTGARPNQFRGLFGYILLSSGVISLVDIDDFDADCRRPTQLNSRPESDFRGCSSDPRSPAYYTTNGKEGGVPTVTDEASCNVVEPHRARSANLVLTSETNGALAPSLRSFARLSKNGRGLAVNRALPAGRLSPVMLGVDFAGAQPGTTSPAQVYIGNQLRTRGDASSPLIIAPKLADQPSLVLPWVEPRAYPSSEVVTVTYEGDLRGIQQTGLLDIEQRVLADDQALFCKMGVQSVELATEVGKSRFGLPDDLAAQFGETHGDYVQLTNNLRIETDPYWGDQGEACGALTGDPTATSFAACDALFADGIVTTTTTTTTTTVTPVNSTTTPGTPVPGGVNPGTGTTTPVRTTTTTTAVTTTTTTSTTGDDLVQARDFRILRAYQDHLEVEPRYATGAAAERLLSMVECCFPGVLNYKVRASKQWVVKGDATGFRHSIVATPVTEDGKTQYLCAEDCSPIRREQGRAFEISATDCANPDSESADYCPVGPRTQEDLVCSYAARRGPVEPGGVASECIFDGQTRRFAVYRGLEPTERGMSFGFEVIGGFVTKTVPLTDSTTKIILPVSLSAVPTFGQLGVVDSQSRGLMMIDLQAARVADSFY